MKRYELNDLVDVYIIIKYEIPRGMSTKQEIIKAWSFEKVCAETYMEIHKCKDMELRHIRDYYSAIKSKLSEYNNCKLTIAILQIKDPEHHHRLMNVGCPVTENEYNQINSEVDSACSGLINYSEIWDMIFYLKDEYQEALAALHFHQCRDIARNVPCSFAKELNYDHMQLMLRLFPGDFGE